jgi:hypothetical protein
MGDKTTFDKLFEYYTADEEKKDELAKKLTQEDKNAMMRWEFIDDLYRRHRPAIRSKDLRNMTLEKFGISKRQFYYDQMNASKFFGTFEKRNHKNEYTIELQVERYTHLASRAELEGDYAAAVRALTRIDKLLRLEEKDTEGAEVQPTTLQINLQVNGLDGTGPTSKIINIDHLQKLPQLEYDQVIEAANQLTPSPEEMETIIKKSSGEDSKDGE